MNGSDLIAKAVGIMFMSRTYAHLAHLKTGSYAKHMALGGFYDCLPGLADSLAEGAMGKWGKFDIPYVEMKGDVNDPIAGLQSHLTMIENLQRRCEEPWLDNIFQEVQALYYSTLYKLKELS